MIAPDDRKAIIQAFRASSIGPMPILIVRTATGYTAFASASSYVLEINRGLNYVVLSFHGVTVRESMPGKYPSRKQYGVKI